MTDKDDEERSDEEDDEELTEEERWKRRWLRKAAEKALSKLSSKKVDAGFEDAYSGQENAHKYYRHHNFKQGAEPRDRVPEVKPTSVSGEPWTEPSRWIPPKPAEEYPRKDVKKDLLILEKQNIENERREQSNGANKDDIRKAEAHINDKRKDYSSEDDIATVEVESPLDTAHDVTSRIASKLEDKGYEHVSTEIEEPDAEELARIEAEARQDYAPATPEQKLEFIEVMHDPVKVDQLLQPEEDSISTLELSEQHEKLRKKAIGQTLEEQQLELLQDFELTPENVPIEEEESY